LGEAVILLDTSVLVASLIASHKFHEPSIKLFQAVKKGQMKGALCIHSLAEMYSSLTNYPSDPRLSPAAAESMILENVFSDLRIIDLTPSDYRAAVKRVKDLQLRGGAVYDSLILQAAIKKRAETLYTWNRMDFVRFSEKAVEIREP
jgi:predicted nucleic acid-binding protein